MRIGPLPLDLMLVTVAWVADRAGPVSDPSGVVGAVPGRPRPCGAPAVDRVEWGGGGGRSAGGGRSEAAPGAASGGGRTRRTRPGGGQQQDPPAGADEQAAGGVQQPGAASTASRPYARQATPAGGGCATSP